MCVCVYTGNVTCICGDISQCRWLLLLLCKMGSRCYGCVHATVMQFQVEMWFINQLVI